MGCYNTTGFLSRLSIKYGDRVVAFICQTTDNTFVMSRYYQDSNLSPIFLPVFGEYDDYGSIENIDDTYSSRLLRQIFNGTDTEKVFKCIERLSARSNGNIEDCKTDKYVYDEYKNEIDILERNCYNPWNNGNFTIIFEHEEIYKKLISESNCRQFMFDYVYLMHKLSKYAKEKHNHDMLLTLEFPFECEDLKIIQKAKVDIEDELNDSQKKIMEKRIMLRQLLFNWNSGLELFMRNVDLSDKDYVNEFTDFLAFNKFLTDAEIGYDVPTCGCGSQNNNILYIDKLYSHILKFVKEKIENSDELFDDE